MLRTLLGVLLALGAAAGGPARLEARQTTTGHSAGISGTVVDATTTRPLPGALITLEPQEIAALAGPGGSPFVSGGRTTVTDSVGVYRFGELPPGRYRIRITRVGYEPATLSVELLGSAGAQLSVGLTVAPISLAPVEVRGVPAEGYGRHDTAEDVVEGRRVDAARARQRTQLATDAREITHADVVESVTLGETDLFRALQRAPGVGARDDYGAGFWVRGASWDQTRVYFDGVPLFNPVHGFGLLSAVNTDAIGGALLHPGVRSASLGDGAAAVLEVRSRPGGGEDGVRGFADLSLASGRLALDGGAARGRAGWMIAGRRSWLDVMTAAAARVAGDRQIELPYSFEDVTARVDLELGGASSLEVSGLHEIDRISGTIPDVFHRTRAGWGSDAGQVTLSTELSRIRSRTRLGVSRYGARVREAAPDSIGEGGYSATHVPPSDNRLVHLSLAGELSPISARGLPAWKAGYGLIYEGSAYDGPEGYAYHQFRTSDADSALELRSAASRAVLWGERRWGGNRGLSVEAGLRLELGPEVENGGIVRPAPRAVARYAPSADLSISAGLGRSWQHAQALAGTGPQLGAGYVASQVWLIADPATPIIRADVATAGAELWLGSRWLLGANGYVRRTSGLVLSDPRPGLLRGRPLFVSAANDARGMDLSARRLAGRWTASAAYSLAESTIEAAGLRFPASEDRRHALDLTSMVRIGRALRLGAAFTYATGSPYTRIHERTGDCSGGICEIEVVAEAPNALRSGPYSSLDLLLDWTARLRGWDLGVYLQLRNALNHDNDVTFSDSYMTCGRWAGGTGCADAVTFQDRFQEGLPTLPLVGLRAAF